MTAKLLHISAHTRRAPSKPKAWHDKHAELRREVDEMRIDQMGEILAEALLLAFADDPEFSDRTQESW